MISILCWILLMSLNVTKPATDNLVSSKSLRLLTVFLVFLGFQFSTLGLNCSRPTKVDSLAAVTPTCYADASLGINHQRNSCAGCIFHAIVTPFSHLSVIDNNKLGSSIDEFNRLVSKTFFLLSVLLEDSLNDVSIIAAKIPASSGIHLTNHAKVIRTVVILV